jgi:enoyl-CoA hydratase/carnithine racemase
VVGARKEAPMSEVLSETSDGIMTITLNRPEAGNSLNAAVGRALVEHFGCRRRCRGASW